MSFYIIGEIKNIEVIARGPGIRDFHRLQKTYGGGSWRKMKGTALIKLYNGRVRSAEIHWYEAHGIGKKELSVTKIEHCNHDEPCCRSERFSDS
jgi:hypothetical protein